MIAVSTASGEEEWNAYWWIPIKEQPTVTP
jgi:hypothetical protein